ncbi:EVE domain-containing protein [Candidatus Kaiserbacteria bacterium RIFCSPHIGHO2_02_FULL_49_34]|uniref:EVE domain-containing protein n=1 Tax=Candidatus Kaiserbacteria bacterium RIFCSPHIGHO2_02_FULL_49_34 TaxID=1798491 RepID=A0A1F6DL66_9BACT|nr:MAG: EVE domain-containing protein [Candidatus Kaiserbacteria bacterium RIFCSPHIGHO2_02_FULL_49_34]
MKKYERAWLMKSEPCCYSIDDLMRDGVTPWEGVRNYQARNFMWRDMKVGDLVFFYHSNEKPSHIAGLGEVASEPYPDKTQFDPKDEYFDPKATKEKPRWFLVDVKFKEKFAEPITLPQLKLDPDFATLPLLQKGSRLSILPINSIHAELLVEIGRSV